MVKDKFERTKPHVNVGTIAHSLPRNHGGSYARALLRIAAVQAALANPANISTAPSDWGNDTGVKTYTNMNHGPMEDGRNRAERRADKKKKHGPKSGSRYKKGRWWE